VKIKAMGVEVPGKVTKSFDGTVTTLILDEDQLRHVQGEVSEILNFVDGKGK
jgi:hypothetical protein